MPVGNKSKSYLNSTDRRKRRLNNLSFCLSLKLNYREPFMLANYPKSEYGTLTDGESSRYSILPITTLIAPPARRRLTTAQSSIATASK
jgi:hypothetical protein